MTDWIRDLIARRRKIFKRKTKRSATWYSLKQKTSDIITHRKREHHKFLKEKLIGDN